MKESETGRNDEKTKEAKTRVLAILLCSAVMVSIASALVFAAEA